MKQGEDTGRREWERGAIFDIPRSVIFDIPRSVIFNTNPSVENDTPKASFPQRSVVALSIYFRKGLRKYSKRWIGSDNIRAASLSGAKFLMIVSS